MFLEIFYEKIKMQLIFGIKTCRVMIWSPSPIWLGYKSNKLSTINLQRIGEKAKLFANGITASKDLNYEQV